jgi:predicted  nucleic acid-binding Zn-ribbon protein
MADILDMSDDDARKLFQDLTAQRDAIVKKSEPLRAKRDKLVNDHREREQAINEEIRATEDGLATIDQKRARIVRMLGGKTAEPATGEENA